MSVLETSLKKHIKKSFNSNIGTIYLFENIVVSEINEGVHLTVESSLEYIKLISKFFSNKKPFGYISNRINSFSVEAIDYKKFTNLLENMKVFSAVNHNENNILNVDIEKKFCDIPYKTYDCIIQSYKEIDYLITSYKKENLPI